MRAGNHHLPSNERLEFLGDSIVNFVIADKLFAMYPQYPEGDLSRLRASLVNQDGLANIARDLNLFSISWQFLMLFYQAFLFHLLKKLLIHFFEYS